MTVRRRRSGEVPAEVVAGAPQGASVQWRATVVLNLVLQSSFLLSIATCRCTPSLSPRLTCINGAWRGRQGCQPGVIRNESMLVEIQSCSILSPGSSTQCA